MYDVDISEKLSQKYLEEDYSQKGDRLVVAYAALLSVIKDLNLPKEKILQINGFLNYKTA